MRYAVIARSTLTGDALNTWIGALHGSSSRSSPAAVALIDVLPWLGTKDGVVTCFKHVARQLADLVKEHAGHEFVALVDKVRPADLDPVAGDDPWNRLVALWILAFPDMRWVFGVSAGQDIPPWWERRHGFPSLLGPSHDPLFDGMGLRLHVCTLARRASQGKEEPEWIPVRERWCVAVDDETSYAYLHAYVAFRHGYRAFAVTTETLADYCLDDADVPCLGGLDLALEDVFLGFPDKTRPHSALRDRELRWVKLAPRDQQVESCLPRRYIITSDHKTAGEIWSENRAFLRGLQAAGRGGKKAMKPIPGMYTLWKHLGLEETLFNRHPTSGRIYGGLAPGFYWPPTDQTHALIGDRTAGHSSPGLLLLVADSLIERAESTLVDVENVKDAVRGAVLACTALEILGPRTPTTARDALELKHRFETLAECQFGGVEYNLQLSTRLGEIRSDMALLGRWYGIGTRDAAVLNGELTIVSRLAAIYREYAEFDELEVCLQRIRTLQRRIWWKQVRGNPVAWLVLPIRAYIEFLLGSITRFAIAMALWIGGLSIAFWLVRPAARAVTSRADPGDLQSLGQALSAFFGAEPLASDHIGWVALTIVGVVAGFIHLGVFISHLYSGISRR